MKIHVQISLNSFIFPVFYNSRNVYEFRMHYLLLAQLISPHCELISSITELVSSLPEVLKYRGG